LPNTDFEGLSDRQREALSLAAQGMTARQVAQVMGISYITVNRHWELARKKLNVSSTSEAALLLAAYQEEDRSISRQNLKASKNVFNRSLLVRIDDLELSMRTANGLLRSNIILVGDLVQMTESDVLRIPGFGRKSFNEIKEVLASLDLYLGMDQINWPPADIEQIVDKLLIAKSVREIPQVKLGTTFRPGSEKLEISIEADENDKSVACDPLTKQLHQESRRKLQVFAEATKGLNNQYGWSRAEEVSRRFIGLLDRVTEDIPEVIGLVYSAALELGSFLELDNQLRSGEISYAESLRPEVRRPLEDLVKTVAPWVRRFPSAREIDNETGEFLSQIVLVSHARSATDSALRYELIAEEVADVVHGLLEAGTLKGSVSQKSSTRGVLSARNMAVAAATAATSTWLGTAGSELVPKSVLAQRAAGFLASAEAPIVELFKNLPTDIQLAINMLINEMNDESVVPPPPAPLVIS
jgi:DNA-binding CsgD family transcriptional regulator